MQFLFVAVKKQGISMLNRTVRERIEDLPIPAFYGTLYRKVTTSER